MGIRIDALPTTVAPNQNHVVPAMNEGITVKLSLAQIIALGRTATELANGTDFNTITSNGLFVLTSNVNAPVTGGRWLVSCYVDPAAPGRIVQQAIRITGGDAPSVYTRRSASGVFGAWSGGSTVENAFSIKRTTELGNANLAFLDYEGNAVAFIYSTPSSRFLGIRRINDNGTVSELKFLANSITYNDNTIYHSGNFDPWALMPHGMVTGLTLSNNVADANNDIDIAPGTARGNGVTATLASTLTKRLDAAWTVGNGNGGLDTGSKAASSTYHVHAIRRNSDGAFDALFSTSATSPVMPSGWTRVQRLGAIMTDGSGNIRPFVQDGNEFRYAVSGGNGVSAYGSTVGNRAYSLLTCPVPTGVRLKLLLSLTLATVSALNPQDGGEAIFGDGANTDVRTHIHRWGLDPGDGAGIHFWFMDPVSVRTNTSGQIYFGIQAASGSYGSQLWVRGWIDESIPRIGT